MPKYREVYLEKEKTLDDSGTATIELSVVDPISEIHIRIKNKNSTTSNKNNPISRNISKIEIVDGANVIYSLSGMLAQAMSYYQRGIVPSMQRQGGPGENQEDHYVIRFGRYLWDSAYALIPASFRNLQLKITYNFATVNDIGVTGFLTGNGKLSVICRLIEGAEEIPSGYLMAKSHYNWSTAASGDERIPLPTDHNYVMFMLRAWEVNVKLYTTISNLKLSLDQDRDIPFDITSWDMLKMMENEFGLITLEQHVWADTEENIQTWLGIGETAVTTPETLAADPATLRAITNIYGVDSGHLNLVNVTHAGGDTAVGIHHLITRGQALNHCMVYRFGDMAMPSTWLNMAQYGDIKAVISQGNAGASADLVLLQARMY